MQAKDLIVDQLRQLEQVLSSQDIDYLRLEGNIGSEDLIGKKLCRPEETPATVLSGLVKQRGCVIRSLELCNIQTMNYVKVSIFRPTVTKGLPNGNGPALVELLSAVGLSHSSLRTLEALTLTCVQLDERILNSVTLIVQSNFLRELALTKCNLGSPSNLINV